jgi:hypothetical protein
MIDRQRDISLSVISAALVVFAATLAWRFLTFTGFTNDHYAHLGLAQQMLLGDRPIRDFVDPGWPLTYLTSAIAWRIAGDAMAVEWAITAFAFAVAAACTLVVGYRLSGSLTIAVLVTLAELAIFPRTYSYPKLLAYAAAAIVMLTVATRPTGRRLAGLAAVIAGAFLLRHDHGVYIGVAGAAAVAIASRRDGLTTPFRRVATLTGATALILSPWILFVALNGGLSSYFDTALEFARGEANASNLRSWPWFERVAGQPVLGAAPPNRPVAQVEWTAETTDAVRTNLERRYSLELARVGDESRFYYVQDTSDRNLGALDDDPHVAGTTGLGRLDRPVWREFAALLSPFRLSPAFHSASNADAWLFWLFWALPVVSGLVLAVRVHRGVEQWPGETAAVAALIVLAVAVNAGFLRDILRTRFSDAIVPPALLSSWLLGFVWATPWQRRVPQAAARIVSFVLVTITAASIAAVAGLPEHFERTGIPGGMAAVRDRASSVASLLGQRHRQSVAPPSYVSAALMPFFAYVDRCSSPSDRILVTGEFPDVVVLAGRRFASDGIVMGAWYSSATNQGRTLARMRQAPPLFVVFIDDRQFQGRFRAISAYLAESFVPLATLESGAGGPIPVLVNRHRRSTSTDGDTGWPCFQ